MKECNHFHPIWKKVRLRSAHLAWAESTMSFDPFVHLSVCKYGKRWGRFQQIPCITHITCCVIRAPWLQVTMLKRPHHLQEPSTYCSLSHPPPSSKKVPFAFQYFIWQLQTCHIFALWLLLLLSEKGLFFHLAIQETWRKSYSYRKVKEEPALSLGWWVYGISLSKEWWKSLWPPCWPTVNVWDFGQGALEFKSLNHLWNSHMAS